MDGVILAAGAGTRLRPLTNAMPKALITVGHYPLAEHILRALAAIGVDNIVFVTGHMAKKIESYFGDGSKWEISTSFVHQNPARGTADALATAATCVTTNPFFVAYGDIFIRDTENYRRFLEFHLGGGYDLSLMCNELDDPYEGAAVYLEGDRVTRIVEKPAKGSSTTRLNKRGILLCDQRIFDLIDETKPAANGEVYLTDAVALAIERGLAVGGYVVRGFSSDVGTPERLSEVRRLVES